MDDHIGIAISGLTADARSLAKYMRTEALNHKYVYGSALQASRLVLDVADKHQRCTQSYVRRPYGVGLLVRGGGSEGWGERREGGIKGLRVRSFGKYTACYAMPFSPIYTHPKHILTSPPFSLPSQIASYDQTGPHLFQTDPSGAYYEYVAQAIGSRAQSGKTYLEKYYAEFEELGVDDLIKHALKALSGTTGKN